MIKSKNVLIKLEKIMKKHENERGTIFEDVDELTQITAKRILSDLEMKKFPMFRNTHEELVGAILYLAYRKTKNPRSLDEISMRSEIERKAIGRKFNKIKKILGMKYCLPENMSMINNSCLAITSCKSFIPRQGEILNLSDKSIADAMKYADIYEIKPVGTYSPSIIAGGCLYVSAFVNNEKKTNREVADASGCTEVATRDMYHRIAKLLNIDISEIKIKKGKRPNTLVVHYEVHGLYLCNRSVPKKNTFAEKKTKDINKVTCNSCLKRPVLLRLKEELELENKI